MKLQTKMLVYIIIIFSVLNIANIVFSDSILLAQTYELETDEAHSKIEQVLDTIEQKKTYLRNTVYDWATWDETYVFVQNPSQDYIDLNLYPNTFISLQVNLIVYFNASGSFVYGQGYDYERLQSLDVPTYFSQNSSEINWLLHHESSDSDIVGFLDIPETSLLIASRPILPSSGDGPIAGTLLMANYITQKFVTQLSQTTKTSVTFQPIDQLNSPDFLTAFQSLKDEQNPYYIQAIDTNNIAGYSLIKDVYESPIFLMQILQPRILYQQTITTIMYLTTVFLITSILLGIITIIITDRFIIKRLTKLIQYISKISSTDDISEQLFLHGNDEINSLATSLTMMLNRVQTTNKMKTDVQQQLQQKINELERYKAITVDREIKMIELKKVIESMKQNNSGANRYDSRT